MQLVQCEVGIPVYNVTVIQASIQQVYKINTKIVIAKQKMCI